LFIEPHFLIFAALLFWGASLGCGPAPGQVVNPDDWQVAVTIQADSILVAATISDVHGDFIHMGIRKEGHDNGYTIERSPAPGQAERDWSRVHHWFGELHPDAYLEGRIDDGSGAGPSGLETYRFLLPRGADRARQDFSDEDGSDTQYITSVYSYADGHGRHPAFEAGRYEIEIVPWYTGTVNDAHPAIDDRPGVQYLHYEMPITSTTFELE
jgi:hypothetical protein